MAASLHRNPPPAPARQDQSARATKIPPCARRFSPRAPVQSPQSPRPARSDPRSPILAQAPSPIVASANPRSPPLSAPSRGALRSPQPSFERTDHPSAQRPWPSARLSIQNDRHLHYARVLLPLPVLRIQSRLAEVSL